MHEARSLWECAGVLSCSSIARGRQRGVQTNGSLTTSSPEVLPSRTSPDELYHAHERRQRRESSDINRLHCACASAAERFPAPVMGGWRARVVSRRRGRTSGSAAVELLIGRLRELMGRLRANSLRRGQAQTARSQSVETDSSFIQARP